MNRYFSAGLLTTALMTCSLNGGDCLILNKVSCCSTIPEAQPIVRGSGESAITCFPHYYVNEKFDEVVVAPEGWGYQTIPSSWSALCDYHAAVCNYFTYPPSCALDASRVAIYCIDHDDPGVGYDCP